jgi:oxazoline/thiazoline dehydrogenase
VQGLVISFRKGVSLIEISDGEAALQFPGGRMTLDHITPGLLVAFRTLSSGGATENDLRDLVLELDNPNGLAQLYHDLERCSNLCLLSYAVVTQGQPLAIVIPMACGFQLDSNAVRADTRFRLSRFAYCRREGNALVLESPLCMARIIMPGHTGAALVAELAQSRAYPDLCTSFDGLAKETAQAFVSVLANAALVTEVNEDGTSAEDANPALVQWEFHDLLFHARSRSGRHDYSVGGAYPFLGKIAPLPALKPQMRDKILPLYMPDIEQLKLDDPPFTSILESRKSIRAYNRRSITAEQLGEFLYRAARVRQVTAADPARSRFYEISNRPYPSGGAAYDLEVYLTVNRCEEVPSGIYHYDPLRHQLCKLTGYNTSVEALLRNAQFTAALSFRPQVLITLTSRFQRLSWKYRGLAYATTLKNVGVLYQTMYLVATAMGLAPCALGNGDSSLFAEATGTDYFVESSVGEFILGSLAKASQDNG